MLRWRCSSITWILVQLVLCISPPSVIGSGERLVSGRRILAFRKGSTFFYRMNYKINSIPYTSIFAQAAGFKVVWELPGSTTTENRRFIRDLHESTELLYESHGLDGKSCLVKTICDVEHYVRHRDGVVAKILRLLSRSTDGNETSIVDSLICQRYANRCPLHLIGFNDFTEH